VHKGYSKAYLKWGCRFMHLLGWLIYRVGWSGARRSGACVGFDDVDIWLSICLLDRNVWITL